MQTAIVMIGAFKKPVRLTTAIKKTKYCPDNDKKTKIILSPDGLCNKIVCAKL